MAQPTGATPGSCITDGLTFGELNVEGVNAAASAKAEQVYDAALACDQATLVGIVTRDKTNLSFGEDSAQQHFVLPQDETKRYDSALQVLSTAPARSTAGGFTSYQWPRVSAEEFTNDAAAWQEVVDAGLMTEDDVAMMRQEGIGYFGWRISITPEGTMNSFVAGD